MQVFPDDSREQYVNKVDFGLVKADLLANYDKPQRDRINVAFEWIRFMLGPLSFKKVRHLALPQAALAVLQAAGLPHRHLVIMCSG